MVFNFRDLSEKYEIRSGFFKLASMATGALSFDLDFKALFMGSAFPS